MANILEDDLNHILDNTMHLWDEIRGQRIFITGGTGFFGCWLLESFVWANDTRGLNASATVLTRNPEAFRRKAPHLFTNPSLHFHIGDVCNFEFPTGEFSHIIHAASGADPTCGVNACLSLFEGILRGTRLTLEFARRCNARKFLLTSSGAVYGKQPSDLTHIPEEYEGGPGTTDPASAYGEGKRVSEFLSVAYAKRYGFEAKIARCFAFVGPYLPLDANFAIGNFIGDVLKDEPVVVKGDGTPFRTYLYAADLAIWLWTILFRGMSCRPYNVGADTALTIAELAGEVADVGHSTRGVHVSRKAVPGSPPERYVPSILRAEAELGLRATISLRDSIKRTIIWHRNRRRVE